MEDETMKFGINMFTLFKYMETEESFRSAVERLKDMGYSYIQVSGKNYDHEIIGRVSKATEIPVILTHAPFDRIMNDYDRLMEEHASFNCYRIGMGMVVPATIFASTDEAMRTIDKIEKIAEKMSNNGFKFFYHNHFQEFHKMENGRRVYDYMIDAAPHFNFTFDTYWAQYGGMDIMTLLDRLAGRIECVHLKDYKVDFLEEDGKPIFKPAICALGEGNIDFAPICKKMKALGTEYFLVEQDNACHKPDPFMQVEASANYLKQIEI